MLHTVCMFLARWIILSALGVGFMTQLIPGAMYGGNLPAIHAELDYFNTAPNNAGRGLSIPASCESYSHVTFAGSSCLAASACGTNYGIYQCDGTCSVTAPTVPSGYGSLCYSSANSCGSTNSGTIQCSGACSATTPANPIGLGSVCYSSANSCGSTNSGTIQCNGSCSASTPANPATYGNTCYSSANSCGSTNSGTIQCNGSCSASTPANPAGLGSVCYSSANSCGSTNSGTIQCNGSCSASTPANPVGYGTTCYSSTNSCGMSNSGTIQCNGSCSATTPSSSLCPPVNVSNCSFTANTTRVVEGSRVIFTWNSQYASSCVLTGTDSVGIVENPTVSFAGTRNSVPLNRTTTYTLTCYAADGRGSSCTPVSVVVETVPLPRFQEL